MPISNPSGIIVYNILFSHSYCALSLINCQSICNNTKEIVDYVKYHDLDIVARSGQKTVSVKITL